nr:aspartyl protease family protein At5g10770-like [Tanacetum cinerariifolium]
EDVVKPLTLEEIFTHDQSRVDSIRARSAFNKGKKDTFGSKATLPAQSGITIGSGNYIVTVGLVPISPSVFSTSGMIIDSGTVITRLPPTAYSALRKAFRAEMTKYPLTKAFSLLDTCYDFSDYTTITIPKISMLWSGNTMLDLAPQGVFIVNGISQVCFAFAANEDDSDIGIFGNVQQKTLQVVYDVNAGKLQLGEDPIRARRGGLRAGEEGTSSSPPVECGLEAFKTAIKFCYAIKFELNSYNVVELRLKTSRKYNLKNHVIYHRGQEMEFRSFMVQGVDGEFNFLPVGGLDENESSTKSVNNEAQMINAKPISDVHHLDINENIMDSRNTSFEKGGLSLIGPDAPSYLEVGKRSKVAGKRKVVVEFPSAKELKDATDFHWVIAHVTPPFWKQYLREITKASCDTIREKEIKKDKAYAELEKKCNEALQDLDKNPLVSYMHTEIECHTPSSAKTRECDVKIHIAQDTISYHTFVFKSLFTKVYNFATLENVKPLLFNKLPNVLIVGPKYSSLPLITTHLKKILENGNNNIDEFV